MAPTRMHGAISARHRMHLGRDYEAIRAYKRSLECDTQQPVVLVNLATVYLNQERFRVAERALLKALEMEPNLSIAHERLGYCYWRQQKYTEAAAAYRLAIDYGREEQPGVCRFRGGTHDAIPARPGAGGHS